MLLLHSTVNVLRLSVSWVMLMFGREMKGSARDERRGREGERSGREESKEDQGERGNLKVLQKHTLQLANIKGTGRSVDYD